jgi:hypothetical protein
VRLKEFQTLYESRRYINILFLKPVQLHNGRANGIIKKGKKYTLALQSRIAGDDNFGIRVTRNLTEDEQKARMAQGKRVYLTEVIKQNG